MHGRYKFAEVFLVEKDLVLLVPVFVNSFALGDRDEEVIARPSCLDVKKVRSLSGRNTAGEDLVAVPGIAVVTILIPVRAEAIPVMVVSGHKKCLAILNN